MNLSDLKEARKAEIKYTETRAAGKIRLRKESMEGLRPRVKIGV